MAINVTINAKEGGGKKKKLKIQEVPITFKDRLYGESKMSSGIFKEALFGVWKMKRMRL